ncbi:MAG: hypothetical protein ACYDA1_11085, partial [Vulcanimicrobiaceae bacterium]
MMPLVPILAAVAALTVHTQVDVPIQHVYLPVVVASGWSMQNGHLDGDDTDVTQQQIDATTAQLARVGIDAAHLSEWRQEVKIYARGGYKNVAIAVLMADLGAPRVAADLTKKIQAIPRRHFLLAYNQYAEVNCSAMHATIDHRLRLQADRLMAIYSGAKLISLETLTDPRNGSFRPIPLCGAPHPIIKSAGTFPPTDDRDSLTMYASANVQFSYAAPVALNVSPPDGAFTTFPYSTFGYSRPIIGQQNRAFTFRNGRFAAVPGYGDVAARVQTALAVFPLRNRPAFEKATDVAQHLGIPAEDLRIDSSKMRIYVRLHSVSKERWNDISTKLYGGNNTLYFFVKNCAPYQRYAHTAALSMAQSLAKTAAKTLAVHLGPLLLQTDYAGASSAATCGSDGSGNLDALITFVGRHGVATYGDPTWAWFDDSIYGVWQLGSKAPEIASNAIVGRLDPVVSAVKLGELVTGTATLKPDAYFVEKRTQNAFEFTVTSATDGPAPKGAGNLITDCNSAQERALSNALKVAQFDHPVQSFVAQPAGFLSVACLGKAYVGHTFSSLPTMYSATSPSGTPQASDEI